MITLKLNLAMLKHGLVKGKEEGETIICIPVQANDLFLSDKNNVFLDVVGFEFEDKSDKKYKDTHLLKQSFSKEKLEAMSEEDRKKLPILGNARVSSSGSYSEPKPNAVTNGEIMDGINELPF